MDVEYHVKDAVKRAPEIEAHVPPGAGPQTRIGKSTARAEPERQLSRLQGFKQSRGLSAADARTSFAVSQDLSSETLA